MTVNELLEQLETWDRHAEVTIMTGYFEQEFTITRVENIHGKPVILGTKE